jgi:hypothetical protein
MSFQAYLDTIKEKTGLTPVDFRNLAHEKGFDAEGTKPQQIVDWLAADYGLGRGHAMAIVATLKPTRIVDKGDPLELTFSGAKAKWRVVYESLLTTVEGFGPVGTAPTNSYLSLLNGRAKFAIVAPTAGRLDVGIKLKDAAPTDRFTAAGSWNSMVTHRVAITDASQLDDELVDWLRRAYEAAA